MKLRATIHDNEPPRVVATGADLALVLAEAAAESRAEGRLNIIFLDAENGNQLSLVVGGDETVIGFVYGHGNSPCYASRGDTDADEPILTAYAGLAHHTEFPRKWIVPVAEGEAAAAEFLRTDDLPRSVRREEV